MANLTIEWRIEGTKELSRTLLNIRASTRNLSAPFNTAAKNLRSTFETEVFATRGAVIGSPWKPLRPSTLRDKLRRGFPTDPLVRTGKMQHSFRSVVSSDQAVIYNTADYFKYHQSNQRREQIPRRAMMRLAEAQKQMIVRVFQEHLFRSMDKARFEP